MLVLFLLFPSLLHGRQKSIESNTLLPLSLNDTSSSIEKYGHDIFWSTDSGDNWTSYTVGYYVYVFGKSKFGDKSTENIADGKSTVSAETALTSISRESSSKPVCLNSGLDKLCSFKPVSTISYLIKITKYISLRINTKNGKTTYKISKGKLTEGIYNIKLDNSSFEKTLYYYKLENEKGTKTKSIFI